MLKFREEISFLVRCFPLLRAIIRYNTYLKIQKGFSSAHTRGTRYYYSHRNIREFKAYDRNSGYRPFYLAMSVGVRASSLLAAF